MCATSICVRPSGCCPRTRLRTSTAYFRNCASARFAFSVKESGNYELRVYWQPHENRAKTAPVTVLSADGEKTVQVDQTKPAGSPQGAHKIGTFKFNAGEEAAVIFRTEGSSGNVHLDAVQVVPAT